MVTLTADELDDVLDALDYTVEATWRGAMGSADIYYETARRYEALAESLRGRATPPNSA